MIKPLTRTDAEIINRQGKRACLLGRPYCNPYDPIEEPVAHSEWHHGYASQVWHSRYIWSAPLPSVEP